VQRTIGRRFDDIAPGHTIGLIHCPVLLVHGTDDQVVPADDARAIHAHRRDDRTRLLLLPGGHDDSSELDGAMGEIVDFLNQALAPVSLYPDVVPATGHRMSPRSRRGSRPTNNKDQPMNQETLWSTRYRDAGDDYLFGTEPNRFLAHRAGLLQEGRTALSVAVERAVIRCGWRSRGWT
jgi:hypothetical protein